MYESFSFEDITFEENAIGWKDGIYIPRKEQISHTHAFLEKDKGSLRLHSRIWKETEETGYGVYYYEETTCFVTHLLGSNYQVELLLVNPTDREYKCHVRLNRIIKKESITVKPGEEKKISFTACMTNGEFRLSIPIGDISEIDHRLAEGDVYIKNIEITEKEKRQRRVKPHLFLLSDSTVQSYEKYFYPQTGWGQVFFQFFKGAEGYREYPCENCDYGLAKTYELEALVIENRAIGGRSIRSFYEEGKLDQVLEILCPGDYVFIQFGHNDNTPVRPNRYTEPEAFYTYLEIYLEACARRGAWCVFVTPVAMRNFDGNGKVKISFPEYREQMLRLGKEQHVPVLDLGAFSTAYLNEIGAEESKKLYLWFEEGEYPDGAYKDGVSDRAHLQEYGAKIYANMVSGLIAGYKESGCLDSLKMMVNPVAYSEIIKPRTERNKKCVEEVSDKVKKLVVQEVLKEGNRINFLLGWEEVPGAEAYRVYGRAEDMLTFEVLRTVTKEEKENLATLPFSLEAENTWQIYVVAVFGNGGEGHASHVVDICEKAM